MKKTIIILGILLSAFFSYSQKFIYQLTTQATADNSYYVPVGYSGWNESKKMTIQTLNSIEAGLRSAADDTMVTYIGLTSGYKWEAQSGSNYLTSAAFTAIGLSESINNALFILDSIINASGAALWELGDGSVSVQMTNASDSASGDYSTAIGRYTKAKQDYSFSHGRYSLAAYPTSRANSSGNVYEGKKGSSQYMEVTGYCTTVGAVDDTIKISGSTLFAVPADCIVNFTVEVVAVQTGGASGTVGDSYQITFMGGIGNKAGTTALLTGAPDTVSTSQDAAFDGGAAITADDVNDGLLITCTGVANKNISYVATVKATIVGFRNFNIY